MKKLRMLLSLMAGTLLSMAAFAAASASAFTQWKDNGVAVTTAEAVSIAPVASDPLIVENKTTGISVTCSTGTGAGSVGPSGAGTVTSASFTACASSNTVLCANPVTAQAVNTPWTTQISGTTDNITNSTNNPGWATSCSNGVTQTCTSSSSSQRLVNKANDTDSRFDSATPMTNCNNGTTAGIKGPIKVEAANGHRLQLS